MATSIIPLAIKPAFTATDAKLAERYMGYGCGGLASEPENLRFYFRYADGTEDCFTAAELRQLTWWRALPFHIVLSIEASLYKQAHGEGGFTYVARYDRKAGQRLIRGSRISQYFEGPTGEEDAAKACAGLRKNYPDAGVFRADSIDDAERLLNSANQSEGSMIMEERMAIARFRRDMAAMDGRLS